MNNQIQSTIEGACTLINRPDLVASTTANSIQLSLALDALHSRVYFVNDLQEVTIDYQNPGRKVEIDLTNPAFGRFRAISRVSTAGEVQLNEIMPLDQNYVTAPYSAYPETFYRRINSKLLVNCNLPISQLYVSFYWFPPVEDDWLLNSYSSLVTSTLAEIIAESVQDKAGAAFASKLSAKLLPGLLAEAVHDGAL